MKKLHSRILALILTLIMIATLAACGGNGSTENSASTEPEQSPAQAEQSPSPSPSPSQTPAQTEQSPSQTPAPSEQSPAQTQESPTPSTPAAAEPVELIVFAAASMTETMEEIADLYKAVAPNVTLVYNFDSSGTLLTQIQEGADCDIFISAAQRQMNTLDDDGELLAGTRFDLVENKVALVVPAGNPANIHTFEDAANASLLALGNSDVPVGQYSEEIFTNMGVWNDEFLSRVTLGGNVKEVTTWVSEGSVDCGVVYATDAFSAGLDIVASAPEGTLQTPVVYPAAAIGATQNADAAIAFLEYLKSPAASAVFESVGFAIVK